MSSEQTSEIQRRMYEFIVRYMKAEGMPPTNREIGREMQIASTGHVDYHLTMLEKKGLIARQSKKSRGILRRGCADGTALALSGVGQTSPHVVAGQLREIGQKLRFRHAARQIAEDVANRNTGASHARLPKSDGRIRSDSVEEVHRGSLLS